jgi:hypothetical protein
LEVLLGFRWYTSEGTIFSDSPVLRFARLEAKRRKHLPLKPGSLLVAANAALKRRSSTVDPECMVDRNARLARTVDPVPANCIGPSSGKERPPQDDKGFRVMSLWALVRRSEVGRMFRRAYGTRLVVWCSFPASELAGYFLSSLRDVVPRGLKPGSCLWLRTRR